MHLNNNLLGVELHIHLDGALRADTLYNLAVSRNILAPNTNRDDFRESLISSEPYTLANFLEPFKLVLLALAGDKVSMFLQMNS